MPAEEGEKFFSLAGRHRAAALAVFAWDLARVCRRTVLVLVDKGIEEFDEDSRPVRSCPAPRQLLVLPVPFLPCLIDHDSGAVAVRAHLFQPMGQRPTSSCYVAPHFPPRYWMVT